MYLKFNEELKSKKIIEKDVILKFTKLHLEYVCNEFNKKINIKFLDGNWIGVVEIKDKNEGEKIISKISLLSFSNLNNFIKSEFNDDPKDYYRDILLFSTECTENRLIVRF